jgi:hypothetical protein
MTNDDKEEKEKDPNLFNYNISFHATVDAYSIQHVLTQFIHYLLHTKDTTHSIHSSYVDNCLIIQVVDPPEYSEKPAKNHDNK